MYIKKREIIYNKKQEFFKIIILVSKYSYIFNSTINELNIKFVFFY